MRIPSGWCPPVISWFINPMNTIVISTINHSYGSYKPTQLTMGHHHAQIIQIRPFQYILPTVTWKTAQKPPDKNCNIRNMTYLVLKWIRKWDTLFATEVGDISRDSSQSIIISPNFRNHCDAVPKVATSPMVGERCTILIHPSGKSKAMAKQTSRVGPMIQNPAPDT